MSDFIHHYEAGGTERPPLLLLHGTGGDEHDLVPLGRTLVPGAALLSPRGKVLENGMPRFFRRFGEGRFDVEDIKLRAAELAAFVEEARERYGIAQPLAVGFSNGANIAAAMLLLAPEALAGAVLLRVMTPLVPDVLPDLAGKPVLMLSGSADPIVPADDAAWLAGLLREAGATVQHEVLPAGHGLTQADINLSARWLAEAG
ncbi:MULTISPECIES: alpha/beta hydrolase [unclassified Chelatococcus]|uniref:alpha/beta hydrolase n=1 Tax=unclassified Chelatococcus TaxID=2638111 RepID=UPI0002FBC986|nr:MULTISPECIES: alpha/beta hydrolase [unclassified Chelatococcus]ALA16136.1 hydrolase [Chelatococcus sp. CO-6]